MGELRHFMADGATQYTAKTWPQAIAGKNQTPGKFWVQNVGDDALNLSLVIRQVAESDGDDQLRIGLDVDSVGPPFGVAASLSLSGDGGIWAGVATVYYRITATNALGETVGSDEIFVAVDDVTKRVTLTWSKPDGATGYRVWRSLTQGVYTAALRATIGSGDTLTYVDDGDTLDAEDMPTVNTTGGWNLEAVLAAGSGVWSGTGDYVWRVVAYDTTGIEIANSLEATVNVDVVTKHVELSWAAVPGAATYRVYRSTMPGVYTTPALVASGIAGTTYNDTGTALLAGALVTPPSYGIAVAMAVDDVLLDALAPGQAKAYWVNRVVSAATPTNGNPRLADLEFVEVD